MMPNNDPSDKLVYPTTNACWIPFLAYFGFQRFNKSSFTFKYRAFTSAILNKTDVILAFLVTSFKDEIR